MLIRTVISTALHTSLATILASRLLVAAAYGAELQAHTIEAFERYIRVTEARMDTEVR